MKNQEELDNLKRKLAKNFKILLLSNVQLLKVYRKLLREKRIKKAPFLEKLLKKRKIRSLSGIVNITVLTMPYPCPGECIFCPTKKGFPKSYLPGEPAVERAVALNYHPYWQVRKRLEMLKNQGHQTDKIELRVVGGTFSFYPKNYCLWFIKECFRAVNDDSKNGKLKVENNLWRKKDFSLLTKELKKEQGKNEKAKERIVGISIETRPDFINEEEIKFLRLLGVTMVELGVQSLFDDILEKNKTGINSSIIAKATLLLKDAGFKVLYHLMPGLLGSSFEKDLKTFKILFENENFKPDWLKIYPVVVLKETLLYGLWKRKKYLPYSNKNLISLLVEIKKMVPRWIRIARIFRDIPSYFIVAGCKISNLREVVKKEMEKRGLKCHCIRCREVRENYDPKEKVYLFQEDYLASGGKEIFLSFENKERTKLYSFLRLRLPSSYEPPFSVLKKSAIIREIQTFGELVPLGEKKLAPQHKGLGRKLLKKAEEITKKEFKLKKIAVIAGIGAREYFKKFGYKERETYMIKKLVSFP